MVHEEHRRGFRGPVVEALLGAALAAFKAGTLDELLRRRAHLTQAFGRRLLAPVRLVTGGALGDEPTSAPAWQILLRAALAGMRPDRAAGLDDIAPTAWTERSGWRPLLALLCHYGFLTVPSLPGVSRPRAGESPADQLCALWDVGPSTFYRHLDKGKRRLAESLLEPPSAGEATLARYARLQHEACALLRIEAGPARTSWHAQQASLALATRAGKAVLWHRLQAGDVAGFIQGIERLRVELANDEETDALLTRFSAQALNRHMRFRLCLAQAGLARVRGAESAERGAYDDALRVASSANDKLMLGTVYGALGKFHEARDADRAFACYQESVEFLGQAGLTEQIDASGSPDAGVLQEYVDTLVKLAWLYVLRNDPRSKAILERAESLRERCTPVPDLIARLEQTWGEYWRRSGELQRALEHKYRALHLYEQLGDRQSVLNTYVNLSLIYSDAKDHARAIDYSQRVLDMARQVRVDPETLASTQLNLGVTYFWQGRYGQAIEHYEQALAIGREARLRVHVGRAHYNLAEAYYKRFLALDQPEDERRGDAHAAAALAAWPEEGDPAPAAATRELKREILGTGDHHFYDRLLPAEFAAHFTEMSEVQRHRATLAVPMPAPQHVQAHLAIAGAYLEASVKEREAALALIEKHRLGDRFAPEIEALRASFERGLSREQRLAAQWRAAAADLLPAGRDAALLQHLLQSRSINKSGYAQLCKVSLATASKQLGLLAHRGLLVKSGNGPSTRYGLPESV